MASDFAQVPVSPSLEEKVDSTSDFNRDKIRSLVISLLDTGMLLVRTVRRFDPREEEHAKCLESAKKCSARVEEHLFEFKDQPEVLSHLTANLERLKCEILALDDNPAEQN
jgi:hypothetical protein